MGQAMVYMLGRKAGESRTSNRRGLGCFARNLGGFTALWVIITVLPALPDAAQDATPPQQPSRGLPPGAPQSPMMRPWQMRMRQAQQGQQPEPAQPQMPAQPTPPLPKPIQVQAPPVNQPLAQPSLKVEFAAGKLSVTADREPLSQVLREVGQRTGLDIRGLQDASGVVSVQFSAVSVAQGMQELLGGMNYAVIGSLASIQDVGQARVVILNATSTDNLDVGGPLDAARRKPVQPQGQPQNAADQTGRSRLRAELMSADPAEQDRGFAELNKLDPKEAFDALQDVITNGDGVARLRALQFMDQDGSLDENQVVGALREALSDQDATLRDYAIQALGRQASPEALDALRQQFESGDTATRLSVLEAVSQRSDARSLIQEAANDPDQGVRTMASELLQSGGAQPQPQPQPDVQSPQPIQLQQVPLDNSDPDGTPNPGDDTSDPQN